MACGPGNQMLENFRRCRESEGQANRVNCLVCCKLLENQRVIGPAKRCQRWYFPPTFRKVIFRRMLCLPRKPHICPRLPATPRGICPPSPFQSLHGSLLWATLPAGDAGEGSSQAAALVLGSCPGAGQCCVVTREEVTVWFILSTLESSHKVKYLSVWRISHCLQKEMA